MDGDAAGDLPGNGTRWGLAAVLGCGLCCGGLLGNAAWLGGTAATVGAAAAGWAWLAAAAAMATVGGVFLLRRRRAACAPDETP